MTSSESYSGCVGDVRETPVFTLLSAHRDIRLHMKVIWNLADVPGHERSFVAQSARQATACFRRGLRIHREDEERSVFPRLKDAFPGLNGEIIKVHEQHESEDASVSTVASLCEKLSHEPLLIRSLREELRIAVRHLTVSLETHMSLEERQLFPAISYLPADLQAAILKEMRGRRSGLNFEPFQG